MKKTTIKIISVIFGITASIISFYYVIKIVDSLCQALIAVAFAAMGIYWPDLMKTIIVGISFFILGLLIFYNSVIFTKTKFFKRSRHLIFIGSFFLAYSLYEFINVYFKLGWGQALFFLGISAIGVLSITAGCLRISIDELKTEDSYLKDKKKFSKKIKILSFLILLFLIVNTIFNIHEINKTNFSGSIDNLELNGKIVFQEGSSQNGIYRLCMVDISNPKEINCFEENGRIPYWGPDGKDIFYYKWNEKGYPYTVIYNTIDKTKEILEDDIAYRENKELRELKIKKSSSDSSHRTKMISPDSKRSLYSRVSSIYLLNEENLGEEPTILLESGHYKNNNYFGYPMWYSNNQILFQGQLINNEIFSKEREYIRGFFLMDDDGSNVKLVVPNNGDEWLHYEYPDLYR